MLIVNADDLGRDREATDSALACHAQQRITSASAMVFMTDSHRAAELAGAAGLEVGLHLNFSEPFTGADVPGAVREAQNALCRFLKRSRYSLLIYRPSLRDAFQRVYEAQHDEFTRRCQREPSHLDGHQHMHLATNVLFQQLLPAGTRVRRSFSFGPGEKNLANRCYRAAVDRCLARRHRITDYFFSLAHHLAAPRLARVVALARNSNVELMAHPALRPEFDFLLSDEFGRTVAPARLASYAELN